MRLTRNGKACALFVVALWGAAFVLRSPWAAMAACVLSAYLLVYLAVLRLPPLTVTRHFERGHVIEDENLKEELVVEHHGRNHREVSLRETPPPGAEATGGADLRIHLAPRGTTRHEISWRMRTWGIKRFGTTRVVASDPLKLLEVEGTVGGDETIRVLPRTAGLGKFSPLANNPEPALGAHNVSKPGDGSEFFALRDYQPGDSIRRINWKASARAGRAMVNQVTRDTYARILVFIDVRDKERVGPHERSPHVRNVRAAASILEHHERRRDHLVAIAVTGESRRLTIGANPRLVELLEALSECEPSGDLSLEAAVREHLDLVRPRSPVYIVTSAALDHTVYDAVRLLQALGARPHVVSPTPPPLGEADEAVRRTRKIALDAARAAGASAYAWEEGAPLEVTMLAA